MQSSTITFRTNEGEPVEADVKGPMLVARGQRVRFIVRHKILAFRPEHIVIDEASNDWKVYDVSIHGRSQFTRSGDDETDAIPGDMFSAAQDAAGGLGTRSFETLQTAMNFWIDVAYVGPRSDAPFMCTIRGAAAR